MVRYEQSHINKTGKTYNELRQIIFSDEGITILLNEAIKNLEGEYSLVEQPYGKKDFLTRSVFKNIYQEGYLQGFKDGFQEGALAMEIEYLKKNKHAK